MERLTIPDVRVDEHTTRRTMIDGEAVREHAMDFYWRLKAYEDIGLTPEDCARATEIDDILLDEYYPIGRMRELIKADKDGRVVVLPCKVGDTVWAILDGAKYARECKVDFVNIGSFGATIVFVVKDGLREQYGVTAAAFGKTVFLTRKEAEKALEVMNDGNG